MSKFEWKKGKRKSFPTRDGYGNDINFRLECQLDKGNKRFVLRWQDSTDRDPETGKKKSKTKSFKDYERAYQYVKDFEFREDLRNDKAKKRLTFLSEDQLRDAEIALRRLPNNITLDQLSRNYLKEIPKKEATVEKVLREWIVEAKRANKRPASISSMKDRTRTFVSTFGDTNVHQINYKDVEHVVFRRLKNGAQPTAQTIKNRWSAIRALMNKAINKGYLKEIVIHVNISMDLVNFPPPP